MLASLPRHRTLKPTRCPSCNSLFPPPPRSSSPRLRMRPPSAADGTSCCTVSSRRVVVLACLARVRRPRPRLAEWRHLAARRAHRSRHLEGDVRVSAWLKAAERGMVCDTSHQGEDCARWRSASPGPSRRPGFPPARCDSASSSSLLHLHCAHGDSDADSQQRRRLALPLGLGQRPPRAVGHPRPVQARRPHARHRPPVRQRPAQGPP